MSSHTSTSNANVWVAYPDFEHEVKAQYARLERCMRMIAGTDQALLRGFVGRCQMLNTLEGGEAAVECLYGPGSTTVEEEGTY
jgi:hypothetical protein